MTLCCNAYRHRLVRSLTRKQRNRCYLCHRLMDDPRRSHWRAPGFPTLDHLIPASKGGTDEPDNLKLSCRACNMAKGDQLPGVLVWRAVAGDGLRGGLDGNTTGTLRRLG